VFKLETRVTNEFTEDIMIVSNAITGVGRALAIALSFMSFAAFGDDAMLQICLGAAADYSPVFPTSTIPASAGEVTAVFRFANGETHKSIVGTWIAVNVGAAAPPNSVLIKTTPKDQAAKGRLWFSLPRPLPVGKYRLEVAADGKPWKSTEFSVVADALPPQLRATDALLPSTRTWTYDFIQQAGAGAKINMPGVTPDSEGRYRALVVMRVTGSDNFGQHVEMRRNGQLVFEEWWRVDDKGWAATKRKTSDQVVLLDPPQLLVTLPLGTTSKWSYAPRDASYHQTYKMFGPLGIKTPGGEAPGYVVFVEQAGGRVDLSVERHFVPGVGITRETIITALDHEMVSRQEMILKP
jgi:hypothetical protein